MKPTPPQTISRAALQAGVNVETIRFYERKGLIQRPGRMNGQGYRIYPPATIQRIRALRQGRDLGLTLDETRDILDLRDSGVGQCGDARATAHAKLALVQEKIQSLQTMEAALQSLISACPGQGTLARCPILNHLEGNALDRQPRNKLSPTIRAQREGDSMKTLSLSIAGMHCQGCAQTLQRVLERLDGVHTATVSYDDRQAHLLINPNVVTESQCRLAVKRAGYQVVDSPA